MTDHGRRVAITGLGAVTPIGVGIAEYAAGLRAGRDGARPIRGIDATGFAHDLACEVPAFDAGSWLRNVDPASVGRAARFAAVAARMAAADAPLRDRHGLIAIGTTMGESRDFDRLAAQDVAGEPFDPVLARRVATARLPVTLARELELDDVEALAVPTACAAGNYAIGYGYDVIRAGEADFALCGGADALCRKTFAGFYRLGAMAPDRCRPFDRDRKGMLTGEGAGVVLMEELSAARARGATIYAEVLGYGLNCDAAHPVAPDADSVARCMRLALRDAGVKPEEVDLVSAHGTATQANDVAEARAIREVFGETTAPRTVGMKSMLGHTLGAASALAAIGCVIAINEGFIPPTIHHEFTDPECALDVVAGQAVSASLRVVQNNALAFGGNNAVLILGRERP